MNKPFEATIGSILRGANVNYATAMQGLDLIRDTSATFPNVPRNEWQVLDHEQRDAEIMQANRANIAAIEGGLSVVCIFGVAVSLGLQRLKSRVEGWQEWYEDAWQSWVADDKFMRHFWELRVKFSHTGLADETIAFSYDMVETGHGPKFRWRFSLAGLSSEDYPPHPPNPDGTPTGPSAAWAAAKYLECVAALLEEAWDRWGGGSSPGIKYLYTVSDVELVAREDASSSDLD